MMRVSALTAPAAHSGLYCAAMSVLTSLESKTTAIQADLLARGHRLPRFGADGGWGHETADALISELAIRPPDVALPKIGLRDIDFVRAAEALRCEVAQIRAVDEVESGGGWFEDVRADILDLDGPGGFLDGPELPKILFEAHQFSKRTGHRYDQSHPNLSSPIWNRALYIGGQGEWARLHRAMQLDKDAALMSASAGRYQIMGFNHVLAGFADVEAFWAAMKRSEICHLEAFVAFIQRSKIVGMLRRVSDDAEACAPFALAYNGAGYKANAYHQRIARAYIKHARKK